MSTPTGACNAATFAPPSVVGAEILSIQATQVSDFSAFVPEGFRFTSPDVELQDANFCNVTVSYTHPGQDDHIIVEAWLPSEGWNGRMQALGGGGWAAGRFELTYAGMQGALADGFATITTDAGLGDAQDVSPWALLSPGNVNLYSLQNLASVSLNDEALIGKSLIESFYGRQPDYSYWNGCSQGGRQGLMLAQRYPTAYDGISAAAPAIYWSELSFIGHWPQQIMNEINEYPYGCEIDAITASAISYCDSLDGLADGVVARVDECLASFDPFSQVGTSTFCTEAGNTTIPISEAAAIVVNATWHGVTHARGEGSYGGFAPGTDLTGRSAVDGGIGIPGPAATSCTEEGCIGAPIPLRLQWFQYFLAKNPDFDASTLTRAMFDDLIWQNDLEYRAIIRTADPDLTRFQQNRGKMITFHGLADNVISHRGTEKYYDAVTQVSPDVHDFYRYFEVPGMEHCMGGPVGQPNQLFRQLQAWVENGTAPESTPLKLRLLDGEVEERILHPYPERGWTESC